ncbi:MAG: zinc-ribbon domain-containing protein [Polyangiaceae bacterium]
MDVRCSRCGTEYEFDDALISERGTTVKCTNCGFQFKIFAGEGTGLAPERWVVRTVTGRELVYTTLRELQRGIADKKVGVDDLLSRGKQSPRPLGSIAELEPFFRAQPPARKPGGLEREQRTLHGVAPPANATLSALPKGPPAPSPAAAPTPVSPVSLVSSAPKPVAVSVFEPVPQTELFARRQPAPAPAAQPPEAPASSLAEVLAGALAQTLPADFQSPPRTTLPNGSALGLVSRAAAPPTLVTPHSRLPDRVPESAHAPETPRPAPSSSRLADFDSTLEVPTGLRAPVSSPRNLPPIEIENIRDSFKSYDELQVDAIADDSHARSARSRWIGGVVVVGLLGLLGSTVGRRYIAQLTGATHAMASSDARVAKFLSDGNQLVDEGDFEGAKEEFDKATALAEKDPAVLTALARLETLRADIWWLRLRLLDPNSSDLVQATYKELGRRVGKARTAVDRAFAISPEDPAVLRARVDALRLSGDGDKAREWLAPLSANASVPENAYVIAALDLAEPRPVWPSVIDRLRTAAAAERDPGRARAALIYSLASAGRIGEAETEFAKVDGRPKPHPLLEELRSFLARAKRSVGTSSGSDLEPKIPIVDVTKLPKLDTSPAPEATGDFRAHLTQASAALHKGDLARAEQLYNSVLDEQPGSTEALSGLGDVAKARRDPALAAKMYDRVLAGNPSYLPAILASADQKWDAGDKQGAIVLYRRLIDQAGASSEYAAHAASRIAQGDRTSGTTAVVAPIDGGGAAAEAPAPAPAPAPTQPPATPTTDIDTTDLPGAQ